jgi:hypothetical protein
MSGEHNTLPIRWSMQPGIIAGSSSGIAQISLGVEGSDIGRVPACVGLVLIDRDPNATELVAQHGFLRAFHTQRVRRHPKDQQKAGQRSWRDDSPNKAKGIVTHIMGEANTKRNPEGHPTARDS